MKNSLSRLVSRDVGLLGAILAAALGVRLLGVGRGLPYLHEWDEPAVLANVIGMLQRGDLNPTAFVYPSVYYYMLLPVVYLHYWYLHALGLLASPWGIQVHHPQAAPTYSWYTNYPSFYLWGRVLTTLAGTATVYLVYRIGNAVYGAPAGLLAAAFLALAPGAVYYADTVRVDIPMAFLVTLTMLFGLNILRRGLRRDYILTGLLAGLAISTKQSAVVVIAPLVTAHLLNPQRTRLIDLNLVMAAGSVLAGALAGTPYLVFTPKAAFDQLFFTIGAHAGHPNLHVLKVSLGRYLAYLGRPSQGDTWFVIPHTALGLAPAIAAALGVIVGFRRAPGAHLYLASFPLPFLFLTAAQPGVLLNYMPPVLPFAALFAAQGAVWLWRRLPLRALHERARLLLAGMGAAALLAGPASDAVGLGWTVGHQPDTRTAAVDWLRRHTSPGDRVAFEDDLRWFLPALAHQPFQALFAAPAAGLGWYSQHRIDYAVVGERNPLRRLPAPVAFSRPPYLSTGEDWALDTYPVISPAIIVVDIKHALPADRTTQFPRRIGPGEMVSEPIDSRAPGVIVGSIRLPSLEVSRGRYTVSVTAAWQQPRWLPPLVVHRYRIRVLAGDHPVGAFSIDGSSPRRYTTEPFEISTRQALPIRLIEELQASVWALRPTRDRCTRVPDPPGGKGLRLPGGLQDPRQFTIEAWVFLRTLHRVSPSGEEREARVLAKNAPYGYILRIEGQRNPDTWKLQLALAGNWSAVTGGPGTGPLGSEGSIPTNEWVHAAATADGRAAKLYINGTQVRTTLTENPTGAYGSVQSIGAPLLIGCRAGFDNWFDGLITTVRIWDRARAPDAIRNGMSVPLVGDQPGLVAAWPFDKTTPDGSISDVSGHGNDISGVSSLRTLEPVTTSATQRDRAGLELPAPTEIVVQRVPGP